MKPRIYLESQPSAEIVIDISSSNPKPRFLVKSFKAFLKVILGKAQVRIELHNEFPFTMPESVVPLIECIHDPAAWLSKPSIRPVYSANPGEPLGILIDYASGIVRGTIINDDPFRRLDRLASNGIDSRFDILFFIACRSDDRVLYVLQLRSVATL